MKNEERVVFRYSRLAALLAAVLVTLFGAVAPAHAAVTLDVGWVDGIWVEYVNRNLEFWVGDHTGPTLIARNPADVILRARPESQLTVPPSPNPTCLGTPGSPVWILPQIQNPNLLWLGWSAITIPSGTLVNNQVLLTINARANVRPPAGSNGVFCVYSKSAFSTTKLFDGSAAFPQSVAIPVGANGQRNMNWAFTASGTWEVDFTVTGTPVGGTTQILTKTYTFSVG
jgi:surface-anchored protein